VRSRIAPRRFERELARLPGAQKALVGARFRQMTLRILRHPEIIHKSEDRQLVEVASPDTVPLEESVRAVSRIRRMKSAEGGQNGGRQPDIG
jgi:hypothetical protein